MHQDRSRLSSLVAAGAPVGDQLKRLAGMAASWHAAADRAAPEDGFGTPTLIRESFGCALDDLAAAASAIVPVQTFDDMSALVDRYVAGRSTLFYSRALAGRICVTHGGLRADHVRCTPDGPRVIEVLRQNVRHDYGDVLTDVDALALDLEELGSPLLAKRFLDWYAVAAEDAHPRSLDYFYMALLALHRATGSATHYRAGDDAARLEVIRQVELAHRCLRAGEVRLVLVSGDRTSLLLSSVERSLTEHAGWVLLRCVDEMTYGDLLARARALLEWGQSVVLDSRALDPARRAAAVDVAELTASRLVELQSAVPERALSLVGPADVAD